MQALAFHRKEAAYCNPEVRHQFADQRLGQRFDLTAAHAGQPRLHAACIANPDRTHVGYALGQEKIVEKRPVDRIGRIDQFVEGVNPAFLHMPVCKRVPGIFVEEQLMEMRGRGRADIAPDHRVFIRRAKAERGEDRSRARPQHVEKFLPKRVFVDALVKRFEQ